jgi:hypothetical protein
MNKKKNNSINDKVVDLSSCQNSKVNYEIMPKETYKGKLEWMPGLNTNGWCEWHVDKQPMWCIFDTFKNKNVKITIEEIDEKKEN